MEKLTDTFDTDTRNKELEKITGHLANIKFESDQGYFKIAIIKTTDNGYVTILGYLDLETDILYDFYGKWENSKYGEQFRVSTYSPYKDFIKTQENIISYISSRLFDGIGPVRAQLIYDRFGEDTIHVVEEEPEKLKVIKGITDRTVKLITESFQRNVRFRALTILLAKEGISENMIDKIYSKYGPDSINVVKNTPYKMAYEIDGIGFKKADRIALAADTTKYHSIQRIQAGIYFALKTDCDTSGNLYVNFARLEEISKKLLDTRKDDHITRRELDMSLVTLCKDKKIILRNDQFYLAKYYYEERLSVTSLVELLNSSNEYNMKENEITAELSRIEKMNGITYSEKQKDAIINSLSNSVSIITGGPGTGKSTIINAIIQIFMSRNKNASVKPCAPTGKAAKRMKDITQMNTYTIHRMLKVVGNSGKFFYNKDNPLEEDMIIVDEFSMVDISLFKSLITAIPCGKCKVIFVGDIDQLPSVGPGNVLRDMIESEYIPTVRLNEIFRQKKTSSIIVNAHVVNEGKGKFQMGDDFGFIRIGDDDSETDIYNMIIDTYKKCIEKYKEVQVLTPFRSRKYKISTESLNDQLSAIANSKNQDKVVFKKGESRFHVGDKVMQIRNNYNKKVFNGEIGTIIGYEKESKKIIGKVDFGDDRIVEYVSAEELDLAYATTIHKSQGSEYQCVIMPIIHQNIYFLNKSIVYTGMTRAKQNCIVLSDPSTWKVSCLKINNKQRKTNMSEDIRIMKNKGVLYDYAQFDRKNLDRFIESLNCY